MVRYDAVPTYTKQHGGMNRIDYRLGKIMQAPSKLATLNIRSRPSQPNMDMVPDKDAL